METNISRNSGESRRIVTCAYCGHRYQSVTPQAGINALIEHMRICQKHPLRKAEQDIAALRAALMDLVQAETEGDLEVMRDVLLGGVEFEDKEEADMALSIIELLLATKPETEPLQPEALH